MCFYCFPLIQNHHHLSFQKLFQSLGDILAGKVENVIENITMLDVTARIGKYHLDPYIIASLDVFFCQNVQKTCFIAIVLLFCKLILG